MPSIGFCWLVAWSAVQVWSGSVPADAALRFGQAVPALLCVAGASVRREDSFAQPCLERRRNLVSQRDRVARRCEPHARQPRHDCLPPRKCGPGRARVAGCAGHSPTNASRAGQPSHRSTPNAAPLFGIAWTTPRAPCAFVRIDSFGHVNLGDACPNLGRTAEADWQFRLATTLSPLSTNARNAYGQFLLIQGRAEEARAEFQRSVDADFNTDAYNELGDIFLSPAGFSPRRNCVSPCPQPATHLTATPTSAWPSPGIYEPPRRRSPRIRNRPGHRSHPTTPPKPPPIACSAAPPPRKRSHTDARRPRPRVAGGPEGRHTVAHHGSGGNPRRASKSPGRGGTWASPAQYLPVPVNEESSSATTYLE
jgi:hypothetical protein